MVRLCVWDIGWRAIEGSGDAGGTIDVRAATVDDLPAMATVFRRASWSNENDRPLLLEHPSYLELPDSAVSPGRSVVAMAAGQVVGFASVDVVDDGVELEALFVDPTWMRRGVGTALVTAVVDHVRGLGFSRIVVDANPHALAFYRSVGFIEAGTTKLESGPVPRMVRTMLHGVN